MSTVERNRVETGPADLLGLLTATARAALADSARLRPARRAVAAVVRALPGTDASVFLKARGRSPLSRIAWAGNDSADAPLAEGDGVADILTIAFTRHQLVLAGPEGDMALPRTWSEAGIRWAAAAALRSEQRFFGGMVVRGRDPGPPEPKTLAFIEGMAALAALGLLARTGGPVYGEEHAPTPLVAELFQCEERERTRLSRELHDEANQALVSLILGLSLLERQAQDPAAKEQAGRLRERTVGILDALRRVARGLRPPALERGGLGPALRALCEDFSAAHGIQAEFCHVDQRCPCRSTLVDMALYRIVQEALTNVARHAAATQVGVVMACRDGLVTVQIEDNGGGCPPPGEDPGAPVCLGLRGMQERAALLGGRVRVESSPGCGTTVYVEIPADFVDGESDNADTDQSADR